MGGARVGPGALGVGCCGKERRMVRGLWAMSGEK